jgi:hypothetical protein
MKQNNIVSFIALAGVILLSVVSTYLFVTVNSMQGRLNAFTAGDAAATTFDLETQYPSIITAVPLVPTAVIVSASQSTSTASTASQEPPLGDLPTSQSEQVQTEESNVQEPQQSLSEEVTPSPTPAATTSTEGVTTPVVPDPTATPIPLPVAVTATPRPPREVTITINEIAATQQAGDYVRQQGLSLIDPVVTFEDDYLEVFGQVDSLVGLHEVVARARPYAVSDELNFEVLSVTVNGEERSQYNEMMENIIFYAFLNQLLGRDIQEVEVNSEVMTIQALEKQW